MAKKQKWHWWCQKCTAKGSGYTSEEAAAKDAAKHERQSGKGHICHVYPEDNGDEALVPA